MLDVLVDGRWQGRRGIGRFAREILGRLTGARMLERGLPVLHPLEPLWLSWVLQKTKARAYYTPGFNAPIRARLPVVLTVHGLIHLRWPTSDTAKTRLYYWAVLRPAVRRAFAVVTVSYASQRDIITWAQIKPEKVAVVYPGVDRQTFSANGPRWDPGYPYFSYVGNRKRHKNLEGLIAAFAKCQLRDMRLVVTGFPDRTMNELTKRFGVERQVVYCGQPDDERLAYYYRGATALVLVSLWEGFGLPALEAMACGTPVLAARAGGLEEAVGDAALLVNPHRVEEIAEGMKALAEDGALCRKLRERGVARAAFFEWERSSAAVRGILERAAAEGRCR